MNGGGNQGADTLKKKEASKAHGTGPLGIAFRFFQGCGKACLAHLLRLPGFKSHQRLGLC